MADNRNLASAVLAEASRVVTQDRGDQHGSAENSFEMIAQFWTIWIRHALVRRHGVDLQSANVVNLDATDVAQMMTLLKKSRFLYGNSKNPDNFIDDAGYLSLAAMLAGVEMPETAAAPRATMPAVDQFEQELINAVEDPHGTV